MLSLELSLPVCESACRAAFIWPPMAIFKLTAPISKPSFSRVLNNLPFSSKDSVVKMSGTSPPCDTCGFSESRGELLREFMDKNYIL